MQPAQPLAIAVIGCGAHGRGHVLHFNELPEARVVAVADTERERARGVAEAFSVPHHYADYRDLLASHALDIVSLALPPTANRDAALAAFAAGAHVMASKPLAANLAQAEDIVAAAKAADKLLTMGLQNRFTPEVRALRQIVAERRLGHVFHTRLWHGHEMHIPPTPTMYRRDLAGGGALFHTTVHLLDAALWALGNPRPIRASASSYQRLPHMPAPPATWQAPVAACDIEDFNIGLVHFANGSTMTIESNWLMHPRPRQSGAELLGDHGTASLRPLKLELEDDGTIVDATPSLPTQLPHAFGEACRDFCRAVCDNALPAVRFSEMLDVQRIMDALYRSAAQGREVEL